MAKQEKADPASPESLAVPILSRLGPAAGAVRPRRRRGRGPGSGLGKTGGKGQKGQKARHPGDFGKLMFEGGQIPLQRRLPKRGFKNPFQKAVAVVNLSSLSRFESGATVDVAKLVESGLVRGHFDAIKVLGNGEVDRPLTVCVHAFSASARSKIEGAGGKAQVVE